MKFKTFRILALGGVVAAVGGAVWFWPRTPAVEVPRGVTPEPAPPSTPAPVMPAPGPVAASSNLRSVDRDTLQLLRAGVGGDKLKDAFPEQPYKVNVYKDAGKSDANRLKIDLDRDEKWDEKWDLERGADGSLKVKRHVAPADDEQYTEEYRLSGDRWVGKDGTASPGAPVAAVAGVVPLRDLDREILAVRDQPLGSDKAKDAIRGKSWKVNLYQDSGKRVPNRLKVDLDRDDKWDEKWDLDGTAVIRQLAPADDEKYTETFDLTADGWRKR
jgi:hypothetical protein